MDTLPSHHAGLADQLLVLRLPDKLVDESAGLVRHTAASKLPNADGAALILDCRDVELINSIGITCLLQLQDLCEQRTARFALAGVPDTITSFLAQLKLDHRFERFPTVEDAIAACER